MTVGLRRSLVAALIVALTLAGLGGAVASSAQPAGIIPGAHAPICHSGRAQIPADPARPASHGCCDGCASLAAAVLPTRPLHAQPTPVAPFVGHARAIPRSPTLARPRDPRLSRGPPVA